MDTARALRMLKVRNMEALEAKYAKAHKTHEYKHVNFILSVGVGMYPWPGLGTDYWHNPKHHLSYEELSSFKQPCLTDYAEVTGMDAFERRAALLLAEWVQNHFLTQMCTPEGRREPLYSLDYHEVVYCHVNQSITVSFRPCAAMDGKYCDGHLRATDNECSLWHATRDAYIGLICRDGIKSSGKSHGGSGRP